MNTEDALMFTVGTVLPYTIVIFSLGKEVLILIQSYVYLQMNYHSMCNLHCPRKSEVANMYSTGCPKIKLAL